MLATLWIKPWRADATAAVRPGENILEVDVVNPWQNRLVGDTKVPADKRSTSLARTTDFGKMPLKPAGLLGPVTLQAAETRDVLFP